MQNKSTFLSIFGMVALLAGCNQYSDSLFNVKQSREAITDLPADAGTTPLPSPIPVPSPRPSVSPLPSPRPSPTPSPSRSPAPVLPTVQWQGASRSVNESVGTLQLTAALSAASFVPVNLSYTVSGTASNPSDHNAVSGSLVIPAGSLTRSISFQVVNDSTTESNETLVFTISTTVGAAKGASAVHTITISDDDLAPDFPTGAKSLIIEGQTTVNTELSTWYGVNIPRSTPTALIYRNNSITSSNSCCYILQAGDEVVSDRTNNLEGEVITGNKLTWNSTDLKSITHGIFTGYNINAVIKYNYLDKVPMGIVRKSNGLTNTSGGVAYNIIKNPVVGMVVKGMKNVSIYNNTFYSTKAVADSRGFIDIYTNPDGGTSTGTKVFNNIFYSKNQISNINILSAESLTGLQSDYNVFWCESGTPMFYVAGVRKTFAEWQAMGYDRHSVVINPNFNNFTDFIPATRLNYGMDLGAAWEAGLSTSAVWGKTSPATTNQSGTWQVGARIKP